MDPEAVRREIDQRLEKYLPDLGQLLEYLDAKLAEQRRDIAGLLACVDDLHAKITDLERVINERAGNL